MNVSKIMHQVTTCETNEPKFNLHYSNVVFDVSVYLTTAIMCKNMNQG